MPVHELRHGLGVLTPAFAVHLCAGDLATARNGLFLLLIARGLVALADVHGVKLLVSHGAAFLRTSLHMEHVVMDRLRRARSHDS